MNWILLVVAVGYMAISGGWFAFWRVQLRDAELFRSAGIPMISPKFSLVFACAFAVIGLADLVIAIAV